MSNNTFTKTKITIIIIVIAVISIIISIGVIFYHPLKKVPELFPAGKTETPQEETPKIIIPKILYNLAGLIKNMDKNSITLEAAIPELDESGRPTSKIEIRKVLITSTTEFSRLTFVSNEGENRKTPLENLLTFKDLKIGDYIEVISNEDISQKEEFEATQIRILPR